VPKGERWIHEIKFDGYRVQLHIANENTRCSPHRERMDPALQKIADDVPDQRQLDVRPRQ
jgi:bifunctional non-homologous end joining protein LigD